MRRRQRRTDQPAALVSTRSPKPDHKTHEDESGIQILIVLLHELFIVILSLLAINLIELTPRVLLSRENTSLLAALWPE